MPFTTTKKTTFRFLQKGRRIKRKGYDFRVFSENAPDIFDIATISISTLSGAILGQITTGVQNTILNSIEYKNSDRGSDEATLILNEPPSFPITVYSKIVIELNGTIDYTGYMYKPQDPGNPKNKTFKYEFFGMRKKYDNTPIATTQNFNISSIAQSGSTTRFNTVEDASGVTVGQMLASRNCTDSLNNGYFLVTAKSTGYLECVNAVGVNQAGAAGDIRVLPIEWSSSNLISDIFKQLVTTYGAGLGITYDVSKIDSSTGRYTDGYIDFNGMTLAKAIENLEKAVLGYFAMGVDREGYYFFREIPSDANGVLNVGYQLHDFDLSRNFEKIINVVNINRAKGHSEGGNGWITASSGYDATSIAKWGRRQAPDDAYTIPEYFSDAVADMIRDSVLASFKDPKYFCVCKNLKADTIYDIGDYIVSTFPDYYSNIFDDMDSFTGWSFGSNLGQSLQNTILATGAYAFKFSLTSSSNGNSASKTGLSFPMRGKQKLSFWIRASRVGKFVNLTITDGVNPESVDVYVGVANEFIYFEWDISGFTLNEITGINFQFQNVPSATDLYIDEISITYFSSLQIRMPFKKVTTTFKAHSSKMELELGMQYDKLSEFMQGLQAQVATHNLMLKDRSS